MICLNIVSGDIRFWEMNYSMKQEQLKGKVQTVLGLVNPDSLGITLPHEHLLCDLSAYFIEPTEAGRKSSAYEPVSLENLSWVRRRYFKNYDNLVFTSKELAIKEALLFKYAGGNTIVELSNIGIARDPQGLAYIARATGLNIIMGSGYYIAASHPPELKNKSIGEIAEEITKDVLTGVGDTGIRAGIIGEIGCSDPLEADERKVIQAAALAQRRTGAAINIHPSPFSDALNLEIVEILRIAGADLNRVVFSHVDQWCLKIDTLRKIAEAGCFIEHDSFGFQADIEFSFGKWRDLPSDAQRLNNVKQLINEGYLGKLLISQDNCTKYRLVAYGGWGYAHILENLIPVMRAKGFTEEHLHTLMVENPKRLLQFVPGNI
jgi:phosphotriesterase-related protein